MSDHRAVIKYRVKCIGAGNHGLVTTPWIEDSLGEPSVCPIDPNDAIEPLLTAEIDRIDTNIVVTEDNVQGTQGFYQTMGFHCDVPTGATGSLSTHSASFPYPVRVFSVTYQPSAANVGDFFSVHAYPKQTIGVITGNVVSGTGTIPISSGMAGIVKVGFRIYLQDNTNLDDLGSCLSVDTVNNTINTQSLTVNSFNAGTPLKISIERIKDVEIATDAPLSFGANNMGGVFFQTGATAQVIYKNNNGLAKQFRYYIELTY